MSAGIFKKEAKERCDKALCSRCGLICENRSPCHDWQDEYDVWQEGAEFGYNKAKAELTKAKEHIENLLYYVKQCTCERSNYAEIEEDIKQAEQFLEE